MLEHVPDARLKELFGAADAVVFPFRRVTTSSSVVLAMATGRTAVIPSLPAFDELPEAGVLRYDGSPAGLRAALVSVAGMPAETLRAMGAAARSFALSLSWDEIADRTAACYREALRARSTSAPG